MKDAVATIGTKLSDNETHNKDAIHCAVLCVIADEYLSAGQHVGITSGPDPLGRFKVANSFVDKDAYIGIVDPFITDSIWEGDVIWLALYPRTVTSLRHDWSHPAFNHDSSTMGTYNDSYIKPEAIVDRVTEDELAARQWFNDYVKVNDISITGQDLIDAAIRYIETGEYLNCGEDLESISTPDELWTNLHKLPEAGKFRKLGKLGKSINFGDFFICSC